MGLSDVQICNLALARVGQKKFIQSLSESSTPAALCNALYPNARDNVFASFPWPFATKDTGQTTGLAQLSINLRLGYAYAYATPTDMLCPQYIWNGVRPGAPLSIISPVVNPWVALWTGIPFSGLAPRIAFSLRSSDDLQTTILCTDQQTPCQLVYTAKNIPSGLWPAPVADAIAWRLAVELTLSLPIKPAIAEAMEKGYEKSWGEATSQMFNTEMKEDAQRDSEFVMVRG